MQKSTKRIGIGTIFILSLSALALWQRQAIFDAVRLHNYQPPTSIVQLADDTAMNTQTRRLFYVYHPELEDKEPFNNDCRRDEQTIVLGCYVEGKGIYLLRVTDERLNGIQQVTAAHETLHAAYSRLSSAERKKVDSMTEYAFTKLDDQRVKDTIELYRKQDPSALPNELHSILGTEIRNLPEDLETYYNRYFSDRSKVVSWLEKYEQAFTERKRQIISYDAQLVTLKQQIDALQTSLTKQAAVLSSERERLGGLEASGQINAYNAAVPGFNSKIINYNKDIDLLSSLISQYNELVVERNAIAAQEQDLAKAIDSRTELPSRQ